MEIDIKLMYAMFTVLGYISGSVMYAVLIVGFMSKKDIREISDDGNPGTANVYKSCGFTAGTACLIMDLAKGFGPVYLARQHLPVGPPIFALVLIAPVLGHAFPPMLKFRGGKCIAVTFGVLLGMMGVSGSWFFMAVTFIFFSTFIRIDPHALRVCVVAVIYPMLAFAWGELGSVHLANLSLAALLLYKHIRQISRSEITLHIFNVRLRARH